jgi:hypothetical protein
MNWQITAHFKSTTASELANSLQRMFGFSFNVLEFQDTKLVFVVTIPQLEQVVESILTHPAVTHYDCAETSYWPQPTEPLTFRGAKW